MNDDTRLDDELAAYTDRLLAGEEADMSGTSPDLAYVVRQLHDVIAPDARPDPVFHERLTQRLKREWTLYHHRQSAGQTIPWQNRRLVRMVALAAVLAVVCLGAVLLSLRGDEGTESLEGTAVDSTAGMVGIVVVVGGVGLLWYWLRQRK